jgi:hypothetical protein
MSNGTRPAVLVSELLSGDGPFLRGAEDFVARVCTGCSSVVERDGMHYGDGYYCSACNWKRSPRLGGFTPAR